MRHTFPDRLRLALIASLLVIASSGSAEAQAPSLDFTFEPSRPVAGETFLVVVSGVGHGCFDGRYETAIEGHEVTLTFSDHCPIFVQPVEFTFRMELTLPADGWDVTVHNSFTDMQVTKPVLVRERPNVVSSRAAGATLLFPYFEVDPTDPDDVTTLVAIGNAAGSQTLARAVLWTDRGIPTLAFDLVLNPGSVETFNLRDVFAGVLPQTPAPTEGEPHPFPGCATPIQVPEVSPAELRAKHSGRPAPGDGLCYSTGRLPEDLVAGYMTVDVVKRCSDALPSDPEYFEGDDPIASTRNVLWGDQFFVDTGESFAQGFEAVVIPADLAKAGPSRTFYRRFTQNGADARLMLPTTHLARATTESGFEGETDLLLWIEDLREPQPVACADPPAEGDCPPPPVLHVTFTEERGSDAFEEITISSPPVAGRFRVGGPELLVTAASTVARLHALDPMVRCQYGGGKLDIEKAGLADVSSEGKLSPAIDAPLQMSVSTVTKALGRFSVGYRGVGLAD